MAKEEVMRVAQGEEGQPREHWSLDKRVPVAIVFAILIQTMGAVWWAGRIDSKVDNVIAVSNQNTKQIESLRIRDQRQEIRDETLTGELNVLTERIDRLTRDIKETNTLLREYLKEQRQQNRDSPGD